MASQFYSYKVVKRQITSMYSNLHAENKPTTNTVIIASIHVVYVTGSRLLLKPPPVHPLSGLVRQLVFDVVFPRPLH